MVSALGKMGSASTASAQQPLFYDAQVFDLGLEQRQEWTISQIKALGQSTGFMAKMYAPETPWGAAIAFATRLQEVFGLADDEVFLSAWRDRKTNEVKRSRPVLKQSEGAIVLSLPRSAVPFLVPEFKIRDFNAVVSGLLLPFSMDIEAIEPDFGELNTESEKYIKPEITERMRDFSDFQYVREWSAPSQGGDYVKLRDDAVPVGLYWCDRVALSTNEVEVGGKTKKITSAKFYIQSMDGKKFIADGTEANGNKTIAALTQAMMRTPETQQFGELATKFEADDVSFRKQFLLLVLSKTVKGNGTTVELAPVVPCELPELPRLSPVLGKFIHSHGFESADLYEQWTNLSTSTASKIETADEQMEDECRADLYAQIDRLLGEKKLTKKAVVAYCTKQFDGADHRDKLSNAQLEVLVEWLEDQTTPLV